MIWNREAECMPVKEREEIQLKRLKTTLRRVFEMVPYYREKFTQNNVKPTDIKSLKDIENLPFTSKADLREGYPFGMFAVPLTEIVEIHTSSGTTGKPVVAGYT